MPLEDQPWIDGTTVATLGGMLRQTTLMTLAVVVVVAAQSQGGCLPASAESASRSDAADAANPRSDTTGDATAGDPADWPPAIGE